MASGEDRPETKNEPPVEDEISLSCPIPVSAYPHVLLAHGGGGKLSHELIEKVFVAAFENPVLGARHDGAVFDLGGCRVAFSTDSYVVKPLFFPGGDIGSLAVHGTVNDLAMCGAGAAVLSAGFVLEEGVPMDTLWRITRSMRSAAAAAGVQIVTGDTKVVDRGKGDQVFINTAGIGVVESPRALSPGRVRPGDAVVLSGDVGRHGMAIMSAREGLEFEHSIESDSASLKDIALELLRSPARVCCMRDLTRGGLAAALVEIAQAAGIQIDVDGTTIPVREDVRAACEILGLDPIHVANEGRFVAFVRGDGAATALEVLRAHPLGEGAAVIGRVSDGTPGLVTSRTRIGTRSFIDMPSGDQLPRIC